MATKRRTTSMTVPRGYQLKPISAPRRKRRSGGGGKASSELMTIGLAVFASNMMTKAISEMIGTKFGKYNKIAVNAIIYMIGKKGILGIKGLETIAMVQLADAILESVGIGSNMSGFQYAGLQTTRTPLETSEAISRASRYNIPIAQNLAPSKFQ